MAGTREKCQELKVLSEKRYATVSFLATFVLKMFVKKLLYFETIGEPKL